MSFGRKRKIAAARWIVQILSFMTIIYGGYALRGLGLWGPDSRYTASAPGVKAVAKRSTASSLHIPATACIYQKEGLCKGCSLYFLSDALTWKRPIDEILPWFLLLVLLMLLGARLWCGWICPLGLLSDLMTLVRSHVGFGRINVSRRFRQGLVWTKYVLLTLSLGVAYLASFEFMGPYRLSLVDPFCQVCPSRIFAAFFSFDDVCWTIMHDPITIVFTVLGLLAFALFFQGLFIRRFWCRLCPIGGLTALFARTGLVMLVKDESYCTHCGVCQRVCPLDVQRVYQQWGGLVTSPECHLCLRCVEACPEDECLNLTWLGFKVVKS